MLVACDAESEAAASEELRRIGSATLPGRWLETGEAVQGSVLLLDTHLEFEPYSDLVEASRSIFVRHLAPVEMEARLEADDSDIERIVSLAPHIAYRLDPVLSFSVQSRILGSGKLPYRKVVLNECLSRALGECTGASMDCRWPYQVVSVLCTPTSAFIGVSLASKNRSAWPGGRQRFKRDEHQISRSEFKLLEALEVFHLELPTRGRALDIGASPGGWTRLLAASGLQVDAVDPALLDDRLQGDPRVTHRRKRIQEYTPGSKRFAAVVNDMKMDARDSIEIMLEFAPHLEAEGVAIMTLKMPKLESSERGAQVLLDMLRLDLEQLATGYQVIGARQLYHNRSEVTVAMTAKPDLRRAL